MSEASIIIAETQIIRAAYFDKDAGDLSVLENLQAVEEIKKITRK